MIEECYCLYWFWFLNRFGSPAENRGGKIDYEIMKLGASECNFVITIVVVYFV